MTAFVESLQQGPVWLPELKINIDYLAFYRKSLPVPELEDSKKASVAGVERAR